ncbi:hypothetical protein [Proteiniclasticum ruminis]|uniref:Uncharacterized protein n=1 Tax=Proteiniclasticum ruminis TaxID=398199 RepID=A0A1I4ZN95_9CLOT|nr:hypothetical protein [Proteiniclasticum ruminis]SFN51658.1 hypothetical protein SAMN04488695_10268 [Proteiniclasticum ruminis]
MFEFRKSLYDYVTVPLLREFLSANKIKFKSLTLKADLIEEIELQVLKGNLDAIVVNQWLNEVVELGAKHVYFSQVSTLETHLPLDKNEKIDYYNTFNGSNKIHEVYRKVEILEAEEVYVLGLGVQYFYRPSENSIANYYLPIKVIYYSNKKHLFISFRPNDRMYKSKLFRSEDKVTEPKLLKEINEYIKVNLNIVTCQDNFHKDKLRRAVYRILEESSKLPDKIKEIIDEYDKNNLKSFISNFKANYEISKRYDNQIEEDLMNILEKYICLNWEKQEDFTEGIKCYPFNISLKDSENTTLIQKSSKEESLLVKSAYHDNKKRLKQEKMCDSVHMAYTISTTRCKVIYGIEKFKGFISFEKFLNKEEMDEIVSNFVQKYYE